MPKFTGWPTSDGGMILKPDARPRGGWVMAAVAAVYCVVLFGVIAAILYARPLEWIAVGLAMLAALAAVLAWSRRWR